VKADDVDLGIWNMAAHTFSKLPSDRLQEANSVRVTARRLVSRGNPVKLFFAPVLGQFANNIETPATAYIGGGRKYFGIVGLDSIRMTGTVTTDSYDASKESYPGYNGANSNGSIATNGSIDLVGTVDINGDARYGHDPGDADGYNEYISTNGTVSTGWQAPLSEDITYTVEGAPAGVSRYSNEDLVYIVAPWNSTQFLNALTLALNVGGNSPTDTKVYPLPGSPNPNNPAKLYFGGLGVGANWTLNLTGGYYLIYVNGNVLCQSSGSIVLNNGAHVKLVVNGSIDIKGALDVKSVNPADLEIDVIKAGTTVDLRGSTSLAAHINAPLSAVTISGTPDFYGTVMGKTLEFNGVSGIHYDESLANVVGPFQIRLVK